MNLDKPGQYDLTVPQGKIFDKTFAWKIDDEPVDLTGYSAKIRVWDVNKETTLSLGTTLDANGNGIVLGGTAGTVQLVIKTAKTKLLDLAAQSYDIQLTRPDHEDIPFLTGGFHVTPEYGDS